MTANMKNPNAQDLKNALDYIDSSDEIGYFLYLVDVGVENEENDPLVVVAEQWSDDEDRLYERFGPDAPDFVRENNVKIAVESDRFDYNSYPLLGSYGATEFFNIDDEDREKYRREAGDFYTPCDEGLSTVKEFLSG